MVVLGFGAALSLERVGLLNPKPSILCEKLAQLASLQASRSNAV